MTSRLSTSSIRATAWASLTLVVGCSLLNREGPTATCADLNSGAKNACSNGIIATCIGGIVTYQVCDSESVCEQNWQTPGQYKCNQNAAPPLLIAAGGTSNSTTATTGSGGIASVGSSTGGSSAGGSPTTISSGTGGAQNGCASGPCAIGSTGNEWIDAIAIDEAYVYFSDCTTLWSVQKAGGFPTVLSPQLTGCSYGLSVVVASYVYLGEYSSAGDGVERLVRVPTSGGALEVVVDSNYMARMPFAVIGGNLYWGNNYGSTITRTSIASKTSQTMATTSNVGPRLLVSGTDLVWCSGSAISRVSTAGTIPNTPTSVSTGRDCDDLAIASDGTIVYIHNGAVGQVSGAGAPGSDLASGFMSATGFSTLGAVAVDDSSVFFTTVAGSGQSQVRKVPRSGGSTTLVVSRQTSQIGIPLLVDQDALYWIEGSNVMKSGK